MPETSVSRSTLQRISADLMLLLTAIIWGGGFVSQRLASPYLGFFSFNGIRFLVAAAVLAPLLIGRKLRFNRQYLWILPAGIILYAASAFQQAGLKTTSAASGGFLTSFYVILVPVFIYLIWKQKISPILWAAALAAILGSYLLSTGGRGIMPSKGDLLVLAGSVLWAFHVIVVGLAVKKIDVLVFSVGQFLLSGVLHLASSLFIDPPTWHALQSCWLAVLYAGVVSIGIGFTLQAAGQKHAPPADAALILSLEAVFSAIFGYLILNENLNSLQVVGCVIIFVSITTAQLGQLSAARKITRANLSEGTSS